CLRLTGSELLCIGEPDLHPLVQVSSGAFAIPAAGRGPIIQQRCLSSSESQQEHSKNNSDCKPRGRESSSTIHPVHLQLKYAATTEISRRALTRKHVRFP